jgi:hypothetical protein
MYNPSPQAFIVAMVLFGAIQAAVLGVLVWGLKTAGKRTSRRYGRSILASGCVGAAVCFSALLLHFWRAGGLASPASSESGPQGLLLTLAAEIGFAALGGIVALLGLPSLAATGGGEPPVLRCEGCGQGFPSRYYFSEGSALCRGCSTR